MVKSCLVYSDLKFNLRKIIVEVGVIITPFVGSKNGYLKQVMFNEFCDIAICLKNNLKTSTHYT